MTPRDYAFYTPSQLSAYYLGLASKQAAFIAMVGPCPIVDATLAEYVTLAICHELRGL